MSDTRPAPIERQVAHAAATWFLRLQAASATEQDHQACAEWRRAHVDHERAWQLAARFSDQVRNIPPAVGRSALHRSTRVSRRTTIKALTSLVVLGSLGIGASRTATVTHLTADFSTGVGERRQVTLSDGTELHLNTDSALDVQYSETARHLVLRRGEVFIRTARDTAGQARPLTVESAWGRFQPLGTRFSVRRFEDHDQLAVLEGSVAATPHATPEGRLEIQAGQQARITEHGVERLADSRGEFGWIDGFLRVEQMRLADFAEELNRYRHGWVRCEPTVADVRISGVFQVQDTTHALTALAMSYPVSVRYVTRYWVTLGPA